MYKLVFAAIGILTLTCGAALAQGLSPNGVKTLAPAGAIKSTGTWNLGTRAGDFIYVAGMRASIPGPTPWSKATSRASARPS